MEFLSEVAAKKALLPAQKELMVLLIEHHMDFVAELVDDVVVLDSGRVIYHGDIQGMRRSPAVIACAYFTTPIAQEYCGLSKAFVGPDIVPFTHVM